MASSMAFYSIMGFLAFSSLLLGLVGLFRLAGDHRGFRRGVLGIRSGQGLSSQEIDSVEIVKMSTTMKESGNDPSCSICMELLEVCDLVLL